MFVVWDKQTGEELDTFEDFFQAQAFQIDQWNYESRNCAIRDED